jgi:peptide chain release factor subunit 3
VAKDFIINTHNNNIIRKVRATAVSKFILNTVNSMGNLHMGIKVDMDMAHNMHNSTSLKSFSEVRLHQLKQRRKRVESFFYQVDFIETPKTGGLPTLPPPRAPIPGGPPGGKSTGTAKVLKIGSSASASPKPVDKKESKDTAPKKPVVEAPTTSKETESKPPSEIPSSVPSKPSSTQNSRPGSVHSQETPESRDANAVVKEQEEQLDEELMQDMYGKEHVNIVFIGHVDAGKSTLGGNILFLTGMVDERTMEKYEREAKEAGRESWYLSWALDSTKEERSKGKTVEVGRARFETEKRRYTILDAPGHKSYVPNMISGAAQADVGVLVISARKGEFETGFDKGGQTREHAVLAKMQGINKLVIVINKMDDSTVEWSKERSFEVV